MRLLWTALLALAVVSSYVELDFGPPEAPDLHPTIEALTITYTILGAPCYRYSMMGPTNITPATPLRVHS